MLIFPDTALTDRLTPSPPCAYATPDEMSEMVIVNNTKKVNIPRLILRLMNISTSSKVFVDTLQICQSTDSCPV